MKVEIPSYFTQGEFENKINEVEIKNITELDVSCRSIIIDIPYFPNLKKLNCSCSNIYSIPLMEKLEEIYCYFCPNIKEIPNFPNLKELNCSHNINISSISSMKNLEKLICFNSNIPYIPYFPSLKILRCYDTNITSISSMEKLEEICCYLCPNLHEIPNFPNLKKLCYNGDLKIKFYNKNLLINCKINFQGRLFQNTYRTYELLMF